MKIPNKQFHHWEANIFLEKVRKSINSQTNIKSSVNDSLTVKFLQILSHRIDWDFTFSALQTFGYVNKFIHIVDVDYANIQSKIKINGLLI